MQPWWCDPRARAELDEAVGEINAARSERDGGQSCSHYASAINKLFSLQRTLSGTGAQADGDGRSFRMLMRAIDPADQEWLVETSSVADLAALQPLIADHYELRGRLLSEPIPPEVLDGATSKHRQLVTKLQRLSSTRSDRARRDVLEALAFLLWIIRSNLVHGEKSALGRDPERVRRNRDVVQLARAVFDDLIEAVLARPEQRLVAYGSLQPGQPNASVLDGIAGAWAPILLRGEIELVDSFPVFRSTSTEERIPGQLLSTAELGSLWRQLDDFEGTNYRRQLVVYETAVGETGVSNGYVGW